MIRFLCFLKTRSSHESRSRCRPLKTSSRTNNAPTLIFSWPTSRRQKCQNTFSQARQSDSQGGEVTTGCCVAKVCATCGTSIPPWEPNMPLAYYILTIFHSPCNALDSRYMLSPSPCHIPSRDILSSIYTYYPWSAVWNYRCTIHPCVDGASIDPSFHSEYIFLRIGSRTILDVDQISHKKVSFLRNSHAGVLPKLCNLIMLSVRNPDACHASKPMNYEYYVKD